ncbi:ABC transporter permease [Virgibacillus profundi]|uniref:ABC transporter permease n=1 Tax=Virgibacillus profundi TaxID=2024555 RepID=A0A2A2IAK4_9BACI|nr:FtsX-like permease family protein [Virgibacillus profundi]PAV28150.1 ABC transporter permease [Virgibacillus profundi]PXY52455.1 ABC transporter permease [Virgibacillus profundi]
MTFRQFAFNNVKRNTRAYLSYFLSCVFAVTVFFMYAVIVFHPDIANYEFRDIVQRGIIVSEVIIYGFSFLFVLYSTDSFIKSRKREYGLLTTLGISKSQLNRLLILENTIIGITSIVTGIIIGALLTKLFLMVFSAVLGLGEVLPFFLSLKAIGITAGLFFIMFELNSLAVVWTLRTKSIMEVFRGSKSPKKAPKFSKALSILSLGAIGTAYYLAYTADLVSMMLRMLPILILIIPGTYFLFTQLSIALTNGLKRNKKYYYHHLNMLTVSDLTFKLKDNARLLFFVTILSAVAFTSSGVLYGLFQSVEMQAERFAPQDVTLISKGKTNEAAFRDETKQVKQSFHEENIPFEALQVNSTQVKVNSSDSRWNDTWLMVYSYSDYKEMVELNGDTVPFNIDNGNAFVLMDDFVSPQMEFELPEHFTIESENEKVNVAVESSDNTLNRSFYVSFPLIVSDDLFDRFYTAAKGNEIYYNYVMDIPNWTNYAEEIATIVGNGNIDYDIAFSDSQAQFYTTNKEAMSYLFFFGIFISVLFFLAAGSILYFRMYQGLDKDLHHFHSLYRIGLTDKEMRKIATKQLALLFFIPFFVALVHAGFAFKALSNMLSTSVTLPVIIVITIYFIIHFANFIFIRNIYTSKLKKVM